jgi:hypothetical protein
MAIKFDILDFLSGLTGYVFDKSVLTRIAWEREVTDITSFDELDAKTIDLLRADLLYTAYLSPNTIAAHTNSHGSFSQTFGSQVITNAEKDRMYQTFMAIYGKYNDEKLEEITNIEGTLQWL